MPSPAIVTFREVRGSDLCPDGSALWIRANDTPPPGYFWKVLAMTANGTLMNSKLMDESPVSGFFLIDWNAARELIGDQNSVIGSFPGVPLPKRGDAFPYTCSCPESGAFPGGGSASGIPNFFFTASSMQSPVGVVPPGKTVVFIGESNPGAVEPGPGQGSLGNICLYVLQIPTVMNVEGIGAL